MDIGLKTLWSWLMCTCIDQFLLLGCLPGSAAACSCSCCCSYMPPEVMTQGRITTATDVYSFGMLMYELAACRLAFTEETAAQIFYMVVNLVSSGDQIHSKAVACWLESVHHAPVQKLSAQGKSAPGCRECGGTLSSAEGVAEGYICLVSSWEGH